MTKERPSDLGLSASAAPKPPRLLGCIFARGGSKGVPGKNIRPLAGKPLIAHAIEAALASRSLDRVIVSTDDQHIAEVARRYGALTPFTRPQHLATDTAPERLAWRHAIEFMESHEGHEIDVLVSIPPTCPLRSPDDIDRCVDRLLSTDADIVLTVTEAHSNPWFNMIRLDEDEYAQLAIRPEQRITRRQDAPTVYDLTAVAYAARRDSVMTHDSIFDSRVRTVTVPAERAVDIDTEFDLKLAEFLLSQRMEQRRAA
ncbi:MAG: acylneuraminate cytidylyltransferase family protein [Planctomycetaceae bacterium]|nr:acylneuraminate cytidylyltransferase family protein [Planctomycetaceae bacterium]